MMTPGRAVAGGGLGAVVLVIITLFLGGDPTPLLREIERNQGQPGQVGQRPDPAQDESARFVRVVLADTEDVWNKQFQKMGRKYEEPKLVLFHGRVESACGLADAAVGPFYCPRDREVYLDLRFFDELGQRFKAPGRFAQAYVIAHEVGHHVQQQLGITSKVHSQRGRIPERDFNQLSVRLELQADFYAGFWAHHAQKAKAFMDPGDMEAALRAANAIGDDRLQKQTRGFAVPDSFTHGTSQQRIRWFRLGFDTGDFSRGNTFSVPDGEL